MLTGLYTAVLGGMKAVMYTSVLQTPVLLFGSIVILIVGLAKVGGWAEIENAMGDNLRLIRPASDPDFPWTGVLLGSAIIGFGTGVQISLLFKGYCQEAIRNSHEEGLYLQVISNYFRYSFS